jgi:hypothetical protein
MQLSQFFNAMVKASSTPVELLHQGWMQCALQEETGRIPLTSEGALRCFGKTTI